MRGVLAVADTLKDDAPHAVAELKAMGVDAVMITADKSRTAAAIAAPNGNPRVRVWRSCTQPNSSPPSWN